MTKLPILRSNRLLIDEPPLQVLPSLAVAIGLNEAIALQQIHYWLQQKRHLVAGRYWVYNSYKEWEDQFPFWSNATIRRILGNLEKQGLVEARELNRAKFDRTKWYTIDYDKLAQIESDRFAQNEQIEGSRAGADGPAQTEQIESPGFRANGIAHIEQIEDSDPEQVDPLEVSTPIPEINPETTNRNLSERSRLARLFGLAGGAPSEHFAERAGQLRRYPERDRFRLIEELTMRAQRGLFAIDEESRFFAHLESELHSARQRVRA
jgi:hypothetical protein